MHSEAENAFESTAEAYTHLPMKDGAVLTETQTAKVLGIGRVQIGRLLDRGEIPSHQEDGQRVVRLDDLWNFEARREHARSELRKLFDNQERNARLMEREIANLL